MRRTIFLRRPQFDLAMKGNAAALKWFLGQANEQLQDLERHEKEDLASLSNEELIERLTEIRNSADRTLEGFAANKTAAPAEPRMDADPGCAPTKLAN
jgi:hypothetical protein